MSPLKTIAMRCLMSLIVIVALALLIFLGVLLLETLVEKHYNMEKKELIILTGVPIVDC